MVNRPAVDLPRGEWLRRSGSGGPTSRVPIAVPSNRSRACGPRSPCCGCGGRSTGRSRSSPARVCLRASHMASMRGVLTFFVRWLDCKLSSGKPKTSQTACLDVGQSHRARRCGASVSASASCGDSIGDRPIQHSAGGVQSIDCAGKFACAAVTCVAINSAMSSDSSTFSRWANCRTNARRICKSGGSIRQTMPPASRVVSSGPNSLNSAGDRSAENTSCRPSRSSESIVCNSSTGVARLPDKNCRSSIISKSTPRYLRRKLGKPLPRRASKKYVVNCSADRYTMFAPRCLARAADQMPSSKCVLPQPWARRTSRASANPAARPPSLPRRAQVDCPCRRRIYRASQNAGEGPIPSSRNCRWAPSEPMRDGRSLPEPQSNCRPFRWMPIWTSKRCLHSPSVALEQRLPCLNAIRTAEADFLCPHWLNSAAASLHRAKLNTEFNRCRFSKHRTGGRFKLPAIMRSQPILRKFRGRFDPQFFTAQSQPRFGAKPQLVALRTQFLDQDGTNGRDDVRIVHGRFLTSVCCAHLDRQSHRHGCDFFNLKEHGGPRKRRSTRVLRRLISLLCHPKSTIVRVLASLSNHPLTITPTFFFGTQTSRKFFAKIRRSVRECRGKFFFFRDFYDVEKLFELQTELSERLPQTKISAKSVSDL